MQDLFGDDDEEDVKISEAARRLQKTLRHNETDVKLGRLDDEDDDDLSFESDVRLD